MKKDNLWDCKKRKELLKHGTPADKQENVIADCNDFLSLI
jgi:hypothetical protein